MADATRADSVPFDAMKVMLAFQRLKRQSVDLGTEVCEEVIRPMRGCPEHKKLKEQGGL